MCATTASVVLHATSALAIVTRAVDVACSSCADDVLQHVDRRNHCRICGDECAHHADTNDHCRICAGARRRCIDARSAWLETP